MFTVETIWDEAKEIFGHCNEKKLLRWITDSVELLANKGEIDPLVGYVDVCVDGDAVTLPREVETVLAVNIGGRPSLGHDELFSFHLNGPGDFLGHCDYSWFNVGRFPTYRDLKCPAKLIAQLDRPEDAGKKIRVFGYDDEGRVLRTQVGTDWIDGYYVPTIYGYPVPDSTAPTIARITSIVKDKTVGGIRLSSYDASTFTGTLLAVFEPDEVTPLYRRIRITPGSDHVRIMYRKRTLELISQNDRILLHSRPALLLAMHALKKYREADLGNAMQFEAQATRLLTERESVLTAPVGNPIQVDDRAGLSLRGGDQDIN